jgi:hypothetical protein
LPPRQVELSPRFRQEKFSYYVFWPAGHGKFVATLTKPAQVWGNPSKEAITFTQQLESNHEFYT